MRGRNFLAFLLPLALMIGGTVRGSDQGEETHRGDGAVIPSTPGNRPDHWTYTFLPPMSEKKIKRYCRMSSAGWAEFHEEKREEARMLSDRLQRHIRAWLDGKAPARLPEGLLPASIDNPKTKEWTLYRPGEIEPEDQWGVRPAHDIPEDFSSLHFLGPDNHVTYIKTFFVAPFGTRLLVEGEFPRARFMDYQILEPFDPVFPTTSGMGAPEVPIVDVDIDPDPGHTNPFRPGADRTASKRSYRISFDLMMGNAVDLNPEAMKAPAYRAPGNHRVGGPFASSGPMGDGDIIASTLWLRYYAPDKASGPLGGVGLPRLTMQLPTGETFWLKPDFTLAVQRQTTAVPGHETPPLEPPDMLGRPVGWGKMFGFWLTFAEGIGYPLSLPWGFLPKEWVGGYITKRDRCLFGRGAEMAPPGNHEPSASGCSYVTYLYRVMMLGEGKLYALTGRLPETPRTRMGERIATQGQARYWSICHTGNGEGKKYPSLLYGCLMDDEVTVDPTGDYVIAASRRGERPANARAECGVTWQDFGLESRQNFTLRWMSVIPGDHLPEHAPHQNLVPWRTGAWSQPGFDPGIMARNSHEGTMGPYQPMVHYFTKEQFEDLGCPVRKPRSPQWVEQ